jgi:mRNA interferase YafQ
MAKQRPPLTAKPTTRFKRDLKRQVKRGLVPEKLYAVITVLCTRRSLPGSLRDHALAGDWQGWRDCHVEPDWILIYRVDEEAGELILGRTGTHSDLFE